MIQIQVAVLIILRPDLQESHIGTHRLCQYNFEPNRCLKAANIMGRILVPIAYQII